MSELTTNIKCFSLDYICAYMCKRFLLLILLFLIKEFCNLSFFLPLLYMFYVFFMHCVINCVQAVCLCLIYIYLGPIYSVYWQYIGTKKN